jgi:hypothetical protein
MHTNIVGAQAPTPDVSPVGSSVTVSEFPISQHECFRADIALRDGKPIVALSRWKHTPSGTRRTGQAFEFGGHRLAAVTKILADAATALDSMAANKGAHREITP